MHIGTFAVSDGPDWVGIAQGERAVLDTDRALAGEVLPGGAERAAELRAINGRYWWLTPPGLTLHRELIEAADGPRGRAYFLDLKQVRARPPVTAPSKILAAGRNYLSHVAEGQRVWAARGQVVERPPFPSGFVKLSSALIGDGDAIEIPRGVDDVDYEIELAVVIGSPARDIPVSAALDHVAGYAIANDVAARSIQLAEMEQLGLLVSKNFPTFAPMGPWLTTTDVLPDPQDLIMTLWVDDEIRQHTSTKDMLFSVAELISDWSRIGLEPGDILLTGTPSGVALSRPDSARYYLRHGSVVTAEISGIGRLRNHVRDAAEATSAEAAAFSASPETMS